MSNRYVVFMCPNRKVRDIYIERALKLGYSKGNSEYCGQSVTLDTIDSSISHSGDYYGSYYSVGKHCHNHEVGDVNEFLFTDKYKAKSKSPIIVKLNAEYNAEVTDVIKVGCQSFAISKLDELIEAVKAYKEQK